MSFNNYLNNKMYEPSDKNLENEILKEEFCYVSSKHNKIKYGPPPPPNNMNKIKYGPEPPDSKDDKNNDHLQKDIDIDLIYSKNIYFNDFLLYENDKYFWSSCFYKKI